MASARTPEAARAALLRALERFRNQPGRSADVAALLIAVDRLELGGAARRREELVSAAVAEGELTRLQAERVHDIAAEEGLEPAFAFELVRSRVAVCDPLPHAPTPDDTLVEGAPEWIALAGAEPVLSTELVSERRMRMSFRRLRGCLERCPTAEEGLAAFVSQPDVDDCGYLLS